MKSLQNENNSSWHISIYSFWHYQFNLNPGNVIADNIYDLLFIGTFKSK